MADLYKGAPRQFSAQEQIQYANAYKRKYRDRSIMSLVTNSDYKGKFYKKGTTIQLAIQPTVHIRETQPGGGIVYQEPADTTEIFTIGREYYWALKFQPEAMAFSAWNPKDPIVVDAADEMAEYIERQFGADVINKVHFRNQGNTAGARTGGFDLGSVGAPMQLYKTQSQCDLATSVQHRNVVADHMVHCVNCIKEQKGAKGQDYFVIVPTVVGDRIQTSELKTFGWMDGLNSLLRKDVSALGQLGGATIIQDDVMLPIMHDAAGKNVYPILFGTKKAFTFADEVVFRDSNMKDIANWDEHHRCKTVCDWFGVYTEFMGVSYVQLAA